MKLKFRGPLLAVVAMLLIAPSVTSAYAAAPPATYTQQYLTAVVNPDGSVTGRAAISASTATTATTYGIWVRGAAGNKPGVAYRTNIPITTTGTSITGSNRYPAGTYTYGVYVVVSGKATTVGYTRTFTLKPQSPAILFEDDFNGPAGSLPDQAKWRDYSGCTNAKQAFGLIRCGNDETLTGTGQLAVPAASTWGSGLTTAGKFTFTYGTMSAWIKTPKTTGYWPAFWSENRPSDFRDVPLYGEADAMEVYTWEPQYAHGNGVHAWGSQGAIWGGDDNYCTAPGVSNFGDTYHKYSIKFEPDRITGYIDDVQCGRTIIKPSDPSKPWPFAPDVNFGNYLILNLAVGGAGGRQPTPPNPDVMLVERVEVTSL